MIPAEFDYAVPSSLAEALELLSAHPDAKLLAGGHSLIPLMKLRLAQPPFIIDLGRMSDLSGISQDGGRLRIGALTTHAEVASSGVVAQSAPGLSQAAREIGDRQVRARGTIGGSLANADPAAEIVLVAVTLGATVVWRDGGETSESKAGEFIIGPMVTSLPQAGCLTEARFPVWPEQRVGVGFHEVNARSSDFAFVSAAAQVALDGDGRCARVALLHQGGLLASDAPDVLRRQFTSQLFEVVVGDHRRAAEVLGHTTGVADVQMFGERAHVRLDAPATPTTAHDGAAWLNERLRVAGLRIDSIRPVAASLEDVFIAKLAETSL